jgi:hypothetical protein
MAGSDFPGILWPRAYQRGLSFGRSAAKRLQWPFLNLRVAHLCLRFGGMGDIVV